jgi:hypothetical protein
MGIYDFEDLVVASALLFLAFGLIAVWLSISDTTEYDTCDPQ